MKKEEKTMKNLKIGDRIRWASAAGAMRGVIVNMYLARNGLEQLVPWIVIEYYIGNNPMRVSICATESYLKTMQVEVLFRDAVSA